MNITFQHKMWMWHSLTHIISIIGLYFIFMNNQWEYLLILPFSIFFAGMTVNIGLHRYIAHKSFKTTKIKDIFLKYSTLFSGLGSPIMWGVAHRHHHAYSDTEKDFQNPRIIGKFRSWFTIYPVTKFSPKLAVDLTKCTHNRFLHKHYFKLQFLLLIIVFLINPYLIPVLLTIPMVACFHGAASIGVLTHFNGYRPLDTKDYSTNNWVASILSLGEGWHNYHHGKPADYRHGHQWWELDPPAWIIEKVFKID